MTKSVKKSVGKDQNATVAGGVFFSLFMTSETSFLQTETTPKMFGA